MAGLLERTMLLGLGVLTLTRDKVKSAIDELVEEKEVEPEEARRLVDALVDKGQEEREELRRMIREEVDKVKPITRKEFNELNQKIDDLMARMQEKEASGSEEEAG
jgi:polyhydroxyalkanoate synthesis regulator phasin